RPRSPGVSVRCMCAVRRSPTGRCPPRRGCGCGCVWIGAPRARLSSAGPPPAPPGAAARLEQLADTAAAALAGEVSIEHAAVIADAAVELGSEAMAAGVEKVLLEDARAFGPRAAGERGGD